MSPSARKGIFVGYTPSSQSWMVYFPATRTVLSSRSVTFDEEWRPLSPSRPFPELLADSGGALPLEREPFLFKHPVNTGVVNTNVLHTIVLSVAPPPPPPGSSSSSSTCGSHTTISHSSRARHGHHITGLCCDTLKASLSSRCITFCPLGCTAGHF
jgi:hypothetical protein